MVELVSAVVFVMTGLESVAAPLILVSQRQVVWRYQSLAKIDTFQIEILVLHGFHFKRSTLSSLVELRR